MTEVAREATLSELACGKLLHNDEMTDSGPFPRRARKLEQHIDSLQANHQAHEDAKYVIADVLLKEIERFNVVSGSIFQSLRWFRRFGLKATHIVACKVVNSNHLTQHIVNLSPS